MTDEALDALAKQLLLDAAALGCSEAEQREEQHTFSPSFERKMKKLVRRADHPVRHRIAQTAACVALVVIIGGGSVLAVSAEARAAFFGWVREVYETYFVYRYEGEETIVPEDMVYIPSWVPDGYEMTVVPKPGGMVTAAYQNDTDNLIVMICNFDTESTTTHVATDGEEALPASVNGIPADFYYDAEEGASSILVWHDEEIGAMFQISAPLPQEDIIKIAESVTTFDAAELAMADAVFRPTWLPDGYVESIVPELDGQVNVLYENNEGNLMLFAYSTNPEILNLQVGQKECTIQRVSVGELPGDLYLDAEEDAKDVLIWMDDQNGIIYWISANLPAEDLIKMAESVTAFDAAEFARQKTVYKPTWLPEGYELIVDTGPKTPAALVYQDKSEFTIIINYASNSDGGILQIEGEGVEAQNAEVNGLQADFYYDAGENASSILVWEDEEKELLFWISAPLSKEDIIKIAESITAFDATEPEQ